MLKSVQHNPQRFDLEDDRIRPFEKLVMTLEGRVLDGVIFQVINFHSKNEIKEIHTHTCEVLTNLRICVIFAFIELCRADIR